jgi:hypothetical protein
MVATLAAATAAQTGEPDLGPSDRLGERRVVSGVTGPGDFPDVRLGISWLREDRKATVSRERADQSTGGEVGRSADLVHRQIRQVIRLGAEVGLFRDLSLFVEAPLVLADDRWLHFDGGVDSGSSTLLRDGILPGAGTDSHGLDAKHQRPFVAPDDSVFRGPTRRGLEYLAIGLQHAIMNQRHDPTRPTWVVRLEPRLALGKAMAFDPARPDDNKAVNPGYHQLLLSTFFARREGRAQPHLGGFYSLPRATSGSAYGRFPLGSKGYGGPQHRAGAEAGLTYEAFARPQSGHRVLLEIAASAEVRFFGLARSELWEPLSGPSTCPAMPASCRAQGNVEVDVDLDGDGQPDPYPGIVRSPGYGLFGGRLGLALELARLVRLTAGFAMTAEQDRFLTDGRSGVESFDRPGRRFRVEDARSWQLRVDATTGF